MYKRAARALALGLMISAAIPSAVFAGSPGIGTAKTAITLATVDFTSPTSTSSADVTSTIEAAAAAGFATTDPPRNGLDKLKAYFNFVAASTKGVTATASPKLSVDSESGAEKESDTIATSYNPLEMPSLLNGAVTLTAMTAEVNPADPSARSSLGDGVVDLDMGAGMVQLNGVTMSVNNDSAPGYAKAFEGVHVDELSVVKLSVLAEWVGGLSPQQVADEILNLASEFAPTQAGPALAAAESERASAHSAINDCLAGVSPTACVPLGPLGLTPLANDATAQEVLDYPATFGANCLTLLGSLPTADVLCAEIVPLLTSQVSQLDDFIEDVLDIMLPMPLISVRNLDVKVESYAYATGSQGVANATWDAATVLGIDLEEVNENANPANAFVTIDTEAKKLAEELGKFPQFAGITASVQPIYTAPVTGKNGDYYFANSELTVLRVFLEIPGQSTANGYSPSALGDPFAVDARFLTLSGFAEHKPAAFDDPGPLGGNPGGGDGPRLALTGPSELILLSGMLLIVLGLRLRRWLGDAA